MPSSRFLAPLLLGAAGLLLLALAVSSSGLSPEMTSLGHVPWPALSMTGTQPGTGIHITPAFAFGLATGWIARWLYVLPWGTIPVAVMQWLRGWRQRAALLIVAVGCAVVLFAY